MKPVSHTPTAIFAAHAGGAVLLCLIFSASLSAQSANSLTDKPVPEASESAEPEAKPDPVDGTPSRFAGNDIGRYTASRLTVFSMRNRVTDPFGLNQDPNVKPIIRQVAASGPAKRQSALPPTPLADIVKLIRVTTIMPSEKKFLVGVRPFSESDEFPLVFQGKRLNMKIVKVSARSILFRNLDNGDEASMETEMLPAGMIAGGGRIRPPGVVSTLENAPLELGSDSAEEANN